MSLLPGSPQLQVLSHVFSNLCLVTPTVQSSCKFYLHLICRLFEYALLRLFSLWESKDGERGGCFGSTGFAGFLAGTFISPGLKLSWLFGALPLLVPCPRQGGVWITLHTPKADFCLPWVLWSCELLVFGGFVAGWGLPACAWRSGCSGMGFSACWDKCCPGQGPAPPRCCWKQQLWEF